MPLTPGGLPYPGPQDKLADTDKHIRDLRAAVDYRLAHPAFIVYANTVACDSTGYGVIPFPALASIKGCVIFNIQKLTSNEYGNVYGIVVSQTTNTVRVRFGYMQYKLNGWNTVAYAGNLFVAAAAWGVAT